MYEQSFANGIAAMKDPTIEVCRRRMNNLVYDPQSVPEALLMLQLSLYALPGAADRYGADAGIKERDALERYDVIRRIGELHWCRSPSSGAGRYNALRQPAEAERHAAALPQGRLCIYEDCGHLPYLEFPERFNAHVREFVAEVRARKAAIQ